MKMFVKSSDDKYLKIDDIDVVLTDNKDEASNFADMSAEDFAVLKKHIEDAYGILN